MPNGPAAPTRTRPAMNMPVFVANALMKAPKIKRREPTAREAFRPHLLLMAELKYGVTIAGRNRLAEMRPSSLP